MTPTEHTTYIRSQLGTRSKWSKVDYEDFYERDVTFLLEEVDRLRAELAGARGEIDGLQTGVKWLKEAAADKEPTP